MVGAVSADEYMERLRTGWRRFGAMIFRPRCESCCECRSLRVVTDQYRPNRSQKRACRLNDSSVTIEIGEPSITQTKLSLYDSYHEFQSIHKSWPGHSPKDPITYHQSFVDNPFSTEEWCFHVDNKLVAVGYVDVLPQGLSAIYFFYDPSLRNRSLGTWNVVRLVEDAASRGLPHVYLGYYVAGCPSLAYKAHFRPNQILDYDGSWRDFR